MSNDEKRSIFNDAINKWGIINQVFMVMEECGELLNVLAKAKRNRASKDEIIKPPYWHRIRSYCVTNKYH